MPIDPNELSKQRAREQAEAVDMPMIKERIRKQQERGAEFEAMVDKRRNDRLMSRLEQRERLSGTSRPMSETALKDLEARDPTYPRNFSRGPGGSKFCWLSDFYAWLLAQEERS